MDRRLLSEQEIENLLRGKGVFYLSRFATEVESGLTQ